MLYTLTVGLGNASYAIRRQNHTLFSDASHELSTRTKLVAMDPFPKVLARVSFCWPMNICGKKGNPLRACKRSNRDFLRLYTGNTYILSSSLSITRGVLRCLLGFLALWGQKPCGGKKAVFSYVRFCFSVLATFLCQRI